MPEWKLDKAELHGHRRARGARGPRGRARGLGAAAARGRADRDGARARARVPQPPADRAAARRARRGRGHVRRDGADRRAADDGLDRGAAGAARPRGRLRDPVPGARGGGGRRRRARGPPGRADDRHRGARDRRRVPRAAALARADGARVRRAAGGGHRVRAAARVLGRDGGAGALAAARPRRRAGPLAARRRRAGRRRPRRARAARRPAPARPARRSCARALRQPGRVLAIGLALAAIGWALDSQTEVVSDVERLVPQDLDRGARPADAAALHRRRGRGRRDRRGRGPHRPEGRRLDARLPVRAAEEVRLLGDQRLRQGRAVPGAVADRPVPRRAVGGDQGAGARAARRGAAVLLPVGDHRATARRRTWRSACGSCRWTASRRSSTTCARG